MRATIRFGLVLSVLGAATACGGSQKEADDASNKDMAMPGNMGHDDDKGEAEGKSDDDKGDKEDKDDKDDKSEKSEKSDKKADKKAEKSDDEKPASSGPTAKDVITKPNSLYVYSFADSEPHQEAEKKCKEKSKDDPKKNAECMTKAGKGQDRDALAFQQNGDKVNYIVVDRKGGAVNVIHKVPCDVGADDGKKITLKCAGKDEGTKPGGGGVPREVTIDLDGESAIAIQDSKLGRLVYQAKLGLMGKQER